MTGPGQASRTAPVDRYSRFPRRVSAEPCLATSYLVILSAELEVPMGGRGEVSCGIHQLPDDFTLLGSATRLLFELGCRITGKRQALAS